MPDNQDQEKVAVAEPEARKKPAAGNKPKPKQMPPYHVVLLDDDDHTYEYVIEMLGAVFSYGLEQSFTMAREVDDSGPVIVLTTHKELAELKRDQILGYGLDTRLSRSNGSMRAVIEPAEG